MTLEHAGNKWVLRDTVQYLFMYLIKGILPFWLDVGYHMWCRVQWQWGEKEAVLHDEDHVAVKQSRLFHLGFSGLIQTKAYSGEYTDESVFLENISTIYTAHHMAGRFLSQTFIPLS